MVDDDKIKLDEKIKLNREKFKEFHSEMYPPVAKWNTTTPRVIIVLLSQMSPVFVPLLLIVMSLVEAEIRGVMYAVALVVALVLYKFFTWQFHSEQSSHRKSYSPTCGLYSVPFLKDNHIDNRSTGTFILMFTLAYLLTPMVEYSSYNMSIISIITFFLVMEIGWKIFNSCSGTVGIVLAIFLGSIFGVMSWFILKLLRKPDSLLYFNHASKETTCQMKSEVKYVCDYDNSFDGF